MVKMFQPRFAPLVESGAKAQTVRPTPKRMPKAGDPISLRAWTGLPYRSKQRVLREATITQVAPLVVDEFGVRTMEPGCETRFDRLAFAQADGFRGWDEMRDWFQETHGLPFRGVLIRWA